MEWWTDLWLNEGFASYTEYIGTDHVDPESAILGIADSSGTKLAGKFKESMGARNRGGIRLSYRPARLHRLAEFIPWN
jgi:aminopeptidase N